MYYSQSGQDKYLHESIFKGKTNGFFVDVGAHDGISINNTFFFEEKLGWKGINVEPIPDIYAKLVQNRPSCINLNCAIDIHDKEHRDFIINSGYTEMISGLAEHYDPRHNQRLERELKQHGGSTRLEKVLTRTLSSVFTEYNVSNVDYLSIDVEGAEMAVIQSIDFNSVNIDIIQFENNYDDYTSEKIVRYLNGLGYKVIKRSTDIFMIHQNSKYN